MRASLPFALDRAVGPLSEGEAHPDAAKHAGIAAKPLQELAGGDLSHDDVCRVVRMLYRDDIDHEGVLMIARDRIAWLAGQLAARDAKAARLAEQPADAATDFIREACRLRRTYDLGETTFADRREALSRFDAALARIGGTP